VSTYVHNMTSFNNSKLLELNYSMQFI